jgi:hypothetical protein
MVEQILNLLDCTPESRSSVAVVSRGLLLGGDRELVLVMVMIAGGLASPVAIRYQLLHRTARLSTKQRDIDAGTP